MFGFARFGMFGSECKKDSVCSVFKHKKSSVCSVLDERNCRIFPLGKFDISVYNVVKRYDSVLFARISNVRLKEKFWKSVQNS